MRYPRLLTLLLGVSLFVGVVEAPPLVAQETTGTILGVVTDPTGAVIPNAAVEVTGPALIGTKTMDTDNAGIYRFDFLPPGVYTVTVTSPGFRTTRQRDINLEVGRTLSIDLTLEVGAVAETVEVSATPLIVDTTSSKATVNITSAMMENLPKGRTFLSLIELAPGARQEPLMGAGGGIRMGTAGAAGGGFQIDGASEGENNYLLEGMSTNLIVRSGFGVPVPVDFVQEVQVKSSGFEAEYGGALGGVVNIVTKRGHNEWHGSGLFYFRSHRLDASPRPDHLHVPAAASTDSGLRLNPQELVVGRIGKSAQYYGPVEDDWKTLEPGFELGGHVVRDKLWLYASYVPEITRRDRTVNFGGVQGTREFRRADDRHNALARVDWHPFKSVRTSASWHYAYRRWTGELPNPDSIEGFFNPDATKDPGVIRQDLGRVLPNSTYIFSGDWTATPKVVISSRFGYWDTDLQDRNYPSGFRFQNWRSSIGLTAADDPTILIDPAYEFAAGTENIGEIRTNVYDIERRTNWSIDGSFFVSGLGSHAFKGGYELNRLNNDVFYGAGPGSAWLRMYWGDQPYTLIGVAPGDPICTNLEAQFGLCMGRWGTWRIIDFATVGEAASYNHSLYFQDAWNVGAGLSLNLGVRFDKEYVPAFSPPEGIPGKAIEFGFADKFAPRLGAAWDVMQNGKLKVFGSWGYFYDIMKYYLPRGLFGGDYWHDCWFTLDNFTDMDLIAPLAANAHTCPATAGVLPGTFIQEINWRIPAHDPADNKLDPNMDPMKQWELVAGSEWAITDDLGLEIRYAHKELLKTIEDMGIATSAGEDYRIGNPGFRISKFVLAGDCDACPPNPRAIREYDALEFRLTKRWSNNWYFSGGYTWSRLYGNYSGLTSSDEPLRSNSPNANRFFDLPHMQFDAQGRVSKGLLATDRPHTAKLYGAYRLPWGGGESTIAVNQIIYQGTPITTEIPVITSAPMQVENRGNFRELSMDPTGSWISGSLTDGFRTPTYTNTDFRFSHEFKLSDTNEALRASIEVNILNIFNQRSTLGYHFDPSYGGDALDFTCTPGVGTCGPSGEDYLGILSGFDWVAKANADLLVLDNQYGLPNRFQFPRGFRFRFRILF